MPAATCFANTSQVAWMSPDQVAAALRCCPAKADRVRMKTRFVGSDWRWPR